jgi:PAS domain S-box-containing protein
MPESRLNLEQLMGIADAVPAAIAVYSVRTAEYLYMSKAVIEILGYTPDEFLQGGLGFVVTLVHPDDVEELLAKNQAALDMANLQMAETGEPIAAFEYRMRHKDGSYRRVRTHGTVFGRTPDGSVEQILNVTLDISDVEPTDARMKRSLRILGQALGVEGGTLEERDTDTD